MQKNKKNCESEALQGDVRQKLDVGRFQALNSTSVCAESSTKKALWPVLNIL